MQSKARLKIPDRRLLFPAILAGLIVLAYAAGWHHEVSLEKIVAVRDRFHEVIAAHRLLAVLAYVVVYVAAAALALPCGMILTLTGGLLFGGVVGSIAAVLGATLGAATLFVLTRAALLAMVGERCTPWLDRLRRGFKQDAFSYLLFLRLVPAFPFWFVNIAPALLDVPLATFVWATFLGIIPATLAFAFTGAGLDSIVTAAKADYAACLAAHGTDGCRLALHASSLVTAELVWALVLLGFAAIIPIAVKRWRSRYAAAQ